MKKRRGCLFSVILFVVIIGFCFFMYKNPQLFNKPKTKGPEVPYAENVQNWQLVYFDIGTIEPVYSEDRTKNGVTTEVLSVFCKCTTAEGKTLWLSIKPDDYTKSIDPFAKITNFTILNEIREVSFTGNDMLRIHGYVRNAEEYYKGLEKTINASTVVVFTEIGPVN